MRKASILVHIKHGNTRSHNLFMNSGFSFVQERMQTTQYVLTFDRYLHPDKEKNLFIAWFSAIPSKPGADSFFFVLSESIWIDVSVLMMYNMLIN